MECTYYDHNEGSLRVCSEWNWKFEGSICELIFFFVYETQHIEILLYFQDASQKALVEYKNLTRTEVDEIILDLNEFKTHTIILESDVTSLRTQYTTLEGQIVRWF